MRPALISGQKALTAVGVVDVGIANLGSLIRILDELVDQVKLVTKAIDLNEIDRLVLPGVGSFPEAMHRISEAGLYDPLRYFAAELSRPVLGICLGMQLLASDGEEHQSTRGLDLISGRVRKLGASANARVPHIGWNGVDWCRDSQLSNGINTATDFYFVHSYVFEPTDQCVVLAQTEHCESFCSAVQQNNLYGVQFHPEKSSTAGRKLLENFCSVV